MIDHTMKNVILIGGWNSADSPYKKELELLRKRYSGAKVRLYCWNSNKTWEEALRIADGKAADDLLAQLNQIPSDELAKTVVVGHSLGARIAVNAVGNSDRKIGELVIMGSAIDCDSQSVKRAAMNVLSPVVNVYSTSDLVLMFYQFAQKKKAFGSQGAFGNYTTDIQAFLSTTDTARSLFNPEYLASFLIPGVGVYKALVTAPALIGVIEALKEYIMNSHCVYGYIKAWLDYDPIKAHLTKDVGSSLNLIPKKICDNIINIIATWYDSEFPDYSDSLQKELCSMIFSGRKPYCDPLLRVEKITVSINQISPNQFDWNVVIDTCDGQNNRVAVLMNLDGNRDRDFMPRSLLNEFFKHNCQYLDCVIYKKK